MLEISGYYINDKIYEGSCSIVYRGRRLKDNLPVVLKMLKNEYPADQELAAFEREYRITSQLQVQGSIRAYSLKRLRNTLVMVLEDFGGHSLTLTGRMNRYLDYRSDLYSLGATLYRLLTGKAPFASNDPLEMIHCHIAREPQSPLEVIAQNTTLKTGLAENLQIVAAIILKLLCKDADERYQSTWGLKYDLQHCLQELEQKGRLQVFEPGSRDISQRLNIPQRLYGRKAELQILLDAFKRVSQGKSEMLLVKGYSGIGKSLLVSEALKPLSHSQAYVIYGKFDQLQGDTPYLALVQAFQDMMEQILTEKGERFTLWKEKLQNALGNNAGVITQVIPELEQIIGLQPGASELPPEEDRNRFHYLFSNFISALTRTDRPLVLFLDDLQWADLPSLQLIEIIMNSQPENLLVDVFTSQRVQVLQLLAAQTAISIQNARLYGELETLVQERTRELTKANTQLEKLTVTDSLTGLYNRLKMDELMSAELTRAKRYKRPFSLILIDLDDFKLINDNLGHLAGDKVLQELSLILRQNIRDTDFICRWGGEEFAVLCPETDKDQVMDLAEKIRQLVAEHNFACQRQISISLGTTTLTSEDTRENMFARADQALYRSKAEGKNTCSYL